MKTLLNNTVKLTAALSIGGFLMVVLAIIIESIAGLEYKATWQIAFVILIATLGAISIHFLLIGYIYRDNNKSK